MKTTLHHNIQVFSNISVILYVLGVQLSENVNLIIEQ